MTCSISQPGNHSFLRYDAADRHDVCRKSRLCCNGDQRKYVSDQRNDRVGDIRAFISMSRSFTQPIHRWHRYRICFSPWRQQSVFEFLERKRDQFAENRCIDENLQGSVTFEHAKFGYDEG